MYADGNRRGMGGVVVAMDPNRRTAPAVLAVGMLIALVAAGCGGNDKKEPPSARTARRTISAPRYRCVEDDVVNDDDEQLPAAFLKRR